MAFGGGGRSGNENSSTVVSTGSSVISSGNSHFCSIAPVLDRAGLPFRSMTVFTKRSSASTPRSLNSERTFVDSDVNQRIEIVGMPVLKSRRGPTSSSKTYEDNEYNRRLARQRMEQSSMVVSSNSGGGSSSGSKHHVDKSEEREWLHEANIRSSASTPSSSDSEITFVDSAVNHRLEIVGMSVLKSSSRKSSSSKVFANNKYNLRMSRLGIEQSSMVVSPNSGSGSSSGSKHHVDKSEETEWLHEANIKCSETPDEDIDYRTVRSARESRGRYNRKTKASVKPTTDGDRMATDKETGPTSS